jgi:hypothetical protein
MNKLTWQLYSLTLGKHALEEGAGGVEGAVLLEAPCAQRAGEFPFGNRDRTVVIGIEHDGHETGERRPRSRRGKLVVGLRSEFLFLALDQVNCFFQFFYAVKSIAIGVTPTL